MKHLTKALGIAGITALSFLPMKSWGQKSLKTNQPKDFIDTCMLDQEWKSYSDSCFSLRKKIYSLVELELKYYKETSSYFNQNNNDECLLQIAEVLEKVRRPLEIELVNQTGNLIKREKELKGK